MHGPRSGFLPDVAWGPATLHLPRLFMGTPGPSSALLCGHMFHKLGGGVCRNVAIQPAQAAGQLPCGPG